MSSASVSTKEGIRSLYLTTMYGGSEMTRVPAEMETGPWPFWVEEPRVPELPPGEHQLSLHSRVLDLETDTQLDLLSPLTAG